MNARAVELMHVVRLLRREIVPVEMAAERYLESTVERSSPTYRAKRRDLLLFVGALHDELGRTDIDCRDITRALIERFITLCLSRGEAPATVMRRLATVKHFCHALEEGDVPHVAVDDWRSPARHIRGPVIDAEAPKWLSKDEVAALLAVRIGRGKFNRGRAHLALCLLFYAGLRSDEARNLLVSHLSDDYTRIERLRRKGARYSTFPICSKLGGVIREYLPLRDVRLRKRGAHAPYDRFPLLVSSWHATPDDPFSWQLSAHTLYNICRDAGAKAGLKNVHPHRLRHTFAHELITRGVEPRIIQLLMGHESIVTTMRYMRPDDDEKRNAVNTLEDL